MITITPEAADKVRELASRDERPDLALRLFVTSGGCSGFSYGMTLDDEIMADDDVSSDRGVKIVVDSDSVPYVNGSEIHYVESMMGAGFVVNNPNATGSCGCGQSFRVDGQSGQAHSCAH
ncbi:MAG: iron-sulfur cluster insertion protein ErpA [Chloroflexi bacterium]|nr:iron-sulfur cluster insertion protein ErpA [Chloroflexota bacterium]MCL4508941.1 iron-sulfur cluster insertion protein ErpA [Chloroflexota bacterium]